MLLGLLAWGVSFLWLVAVLLRTVPMPLACEWADKHLPARAGKVAGKIFVHIRLEDACLLGAIEASSLGLSKEEAKRHVAEALWLARAKMAREFEVPLSDLK